MKKPILMALAFLLLDGVAHAQNAPVADVAAGYSGFYVVKGFTLYANGGSGSVALNANRWLGFVGDFGAYRAPSGLNNLTAETYTFGPRFSYRHLDRLVPFAQLLVGGLHSSIVNTGFTNASNSFAFAAGTGVDLGLDSGGRFALRSQLDYFGVRAKGSTLSNVRFSAGIVFRIGKGRSESGGGR
jgi:hypothetical protein